MYNGDQKVAVKRSPPIGALRLLDVFNFREIYNTFFLIKTVSLFLRIDVAHILRPSKADCIDGNCAEIDIQIDPKKVAREKCS